MSESARRSIEKHDRKNTLLTKWGHDRQFGSTPFGIRVIEDFLPVFVKFMAGDLDRQPPMPPPELDVAIFIKPTAPLPDALQAWLVSHNVVPDAPVYETKALLLAVAILSPLLDSIYRGFYHKEDTDVRELEMLLKKRMGEELAIRLGVDWTSTQCVAAGNWLLDCAYATDLFYRDERRLPRIYDDHQDAIDQLREDLIWLDPVYMPYLKPPPDWTGWWKEYPDRLRATFVRDWRPETRAAITEAFKDPEWEHAKGVNALKAVPLKINTPMVDLVARFAVKVMGHGGDKRKDDWRTVRNDLSVANWVGSQTFYLDYNCDRRGRVYLTNSHSTRHSVFRPTRRSNTRRHHLVNSNQATPGLKPGAAGRARATK